MRSPAALAVLGILSGAGTAAADPGGFDYPFSCSQSSLTADFGQRDALPHSKIPPSDCCGSGCDLNGG